MPNSLLGSPIQTFRSLGVARVRALCRAIGFEPSGAVETLETMIAPWGERAVGPTPAWSSDISDDHTPIELSLGIEGERAEPRFLVESQGADGSLAARWRAGRATHERLRERYGVALGRAAHVEDLFEPRESEARFAMWHAAWMRPGATLFKVYYDPTARGAAKAPLLVEEALHRLGLRRAFRCLESVLARRPGSNRLIYFSVDLSSTPQARVKVYVAHPDATAADAEALLALSPEHVPGEAVRFYRAMTGVEGPFSGRPLQTCYAFTSGTDPGVGHVTIHVPIRSCVDNDQVALNRILAFLSDKDRRIYRRVLQSLAKRPLSEGVGLQTYASFTRQGGRARFTAYLALEAYAVKPPRGAELGHAPPIEAQGSVP